MGAFALPAVIGLMASGTATSAIGAHQQGQAAKNAARYNQRINAIQTAEQVEQVISGQRRQRATNRTRVMKSGVRLSGSPLAVMAQNELNAERQRLRIQRGGALRSGLLANQKKSARSAARMGVASEVLGGLGSIGALGLTHA